MIRYSHVALIIPLEDSSGEAVTKHLGIVPTGVRESKGLRSSSAGVLVPHTSYCWFLDSKKDASYQPIERIHTLLEEIEPFADRLLTLDSKYRRWVDMVFHAVPQHPHGIMGEFDWLSLPADTMARISRLQLMLSYEVFWFDHPDWRLPWHKRLWRKIKSTPNTPPLQTPTSGTPAAGAPVASPPDAAVP
jgi:hypothetical protein